MLEHFGNILFFEVQNLCLLSLPIWCDFHAGYTVCVHQDVSTAERFVFLGVLSSIDAGFGAKWGPISTHFLTYKDTSFMS